MALSHAPWLVLSVFGLTFLWLALVACFFNYTKKHQPAEFAALGEPSFNKGALQVISYVLRRRHRTLGDRHFSMLCDLMLICLTTVTALVLFALSSNGEFPSVQGDL